ncbi:MAG: hypothetical protein KF791_16225 [Verrucomicrobiae bacterium]|nr:hypothetical protein [Verrucomicrobiae bacterium]
MTLRREKPAAAAVLALSMPFANAILMNIPWFVECRGWFLTHHLDLWQWTFLPPPPLARMAESICLLAGFNATFFAVDAVTFPMRHIKF